MWRILKETWWDDPVMKLAVVAIFVMQISSCYIVSYPLLYTAVGLPTALFLVYIAYHSEKKIKAFLQENYEGALSRNEQGRMEKDQRYFERGIAFSREGRLQAALQSIPFVHSQDVKESLTHHLCANFSEKDFYEVLVKMTADYYHFPLRFEYVEGVPVVLELETKRQITLSPLKTSQANREDELLSAIGHIKNTFLPFL